MLGIIVAAATRRVCHATIIAKRNIQTKKLVTYVTDIEGNYDYWQRFVKFSRVLCNDPRGNVDFKESNGEIVFGGDMCDRGSGTLSTTSYIIELVICYLFCYCCS